MDVNDYIRICQKKESKNKKFNMIAQLFMYLLKASDQHI